MWFVSWLLACQPIDSVSCDEMAVPSVHLIVVDEAGVAVAATAPWVQRQGQPAASCQVR
jgi:hypothetical protein